MWDSDAAILDNRPLSGNFDNDPVRRVQVGFGASAREVSSRLAGHCLRCGS
jgi:hypothetical protein